MKNKKQKSSNYLAELINTAPALGLQVAYALEAAQTYDQALACARFSKLSYRIEFEPYIRAAVQSIGTGLDTDAAYKLTSKVATEVINDYSVSIMASAATAMGDSYSTRRHQA